MRKDIIETLINRDKKHIIKVQSYRINELCKTSENNNITPIEKKNSQYESINMINNKLENSERIDKTKSNKSNNDMAYKNEKIRQIRINKKDIDKVNYFHILKSYFCFKDKKTEMIDLCNNIIREDMCIERVLEKFYNLEKLSHHYSGFKGPKKLIKDIDNANMNDLRNKNISPNSNNSNKFIKNENDKK